MAMDTAQSSPAPSALISDAPAFAADHTAPAQRSRGGRRRGGGGGGDRGGRGQRSERAQGEEREQQEQGGGTDKAKPKQRNRGPKGKKDGEKGNAKAATGKTDGEAEKPKTSVAVAVEAAEAGEDDTTAEVCFICAEPVIYSCVPSCNHRTCHICALRLRALYKNNTCAYCKADQPNVIFTKDEEKEYDDFKPEDLPFKDTKLGISFDSQQVQEDTIVLLRFNCPDPTCDVACSGWDDLGLHVKQAHNKFLCKLCLANKKVFTHEHTLFTTRELDLHYRKGDVQGSGEGPTGFKGHPSCGFCVISLYDDDELFRHCREKHEKCHVCDQIAHAPKHQYYVNYDSLEQHFKRDHYVCPERECQERKFVVFATELDLKAHKLEEHPNRLSATELRDARKINANFQVGAPPGRGGRRGPQAAPAPAAPAAGAPEHLSREEQALIRQTQVNSLRSRAPAGFGSQLSEPAAPVPRQPVVEAAPTDRSNAIRPGATQLQMESFPPLGAAPSNAPTPKPRQPQGRGEAFPALGSGSSSRQASVASTPRTGSPVSGDVAARHAAVRDRASALLGHNSEKLALFTQNVGLFRSGTTSATEFVVTMGRLFTGVELADLGKILGQVADLLDKEDRKAQLLSAWRDWKVKNQAEHEASMFPTLSSGSSTGSPGVAGGSRILKIKSMSAPGARTASRTASVWNKVEQASRSSGGVAKVTSGVASLNVRGNGTPSTAWSASSSGSSKPSVSRNTIASMVSNRPPPGGVNSAASFPALQPSAKPSRIYYGVDKKTADPVNMWSTGGGEYFNDDEQEQDHDQSGGKKKKKQKQVLFRHGL